jgi:hypothetical protein
MFFSLAQLHLLRYATIPKKARFREHWTHLAVTIKEAL